jgi:hypothetical protein
LPSTTVGSAPSTSVTGVHAPGEEQVPSASVDSSRSTTALAAATPTPPSPPTATATGIESSVT